MRLLLGFVFALALPAADPAQILIVVGPTNHKPGTHEVAAGGRLMGDLLESATNGPELHAEVVFEWPSKPLRDGADVVVFIGDTFPANRLPNPDRNLAELGEMMDRGVGLVAVHYATGLLGKDVTPTGDHPLLDWLGGYFANRSCPHHESFARIYEEATIEPAAREHPVSRGWKPFTVHDEPYTNNYFGSEDNQPADNVTVLATSLLPPKDPQPEAVAWAIERPDGGRGVGIVMPHFYKNWRNDELRTLVFNAVVWAAKREVPVEGVQTAKPELTEFDPEALEPAPK